MDLWEVLADKAKPIPAHWLAYFGARLEGSFYNFAVGRFIDDERAGKITRKQLARRLNRRMPTLTHWLSSPRGWGPERLSVFMLALRGIEVTLVEKPLPPPPDGD